MTICPKCSYERQETDINPEWECPSCKVAYVKVQNINTPNKNNQSENQTKESKSQIINKLQAQLLVVGFICLVFGYYAGREHLKYQIKSSMQGAFSSIKNSFSPNIKKNFFEEKVADIKTALKPVFVSPTVSNKRFEKFKYDENIWFDITWDTSELKKPTRAIKGILIFADIFGEPKLQIKKTINEPLTPNHSLKETGVGFEFNQFKDSHKWMLSTDLKDMTFKFNVQSIIYIDGTSESYE